MRKAPTRRCVIAFQISAPAIPTAPIFPVGELLASLLSHPPGIGRCDAAPVCGPAGLIVSTRASEGSVANVLAVNSGMVNSGLAQADVVAMAVAGQGPFKKYGPAKKLRVIADLYGEEVHLVAAKNAKIKSVADLRGKRVSLSTEGSGTLTDRARQSLRPMGYRKNRLHRITILPKRPHSCSRRVSSTPYSSSAARRWI